MPTLIILLIYSLALQVYIIIKALKKLKHITLLYVYSIYIPIAIIFIHLAINAFLWLSNSLSINHLVFSATINAILSSAYIIFLYNFMNRQRKSQIINGFNNESLEQIVSGSSEMSFRKAIEYSNDVFWILNKNNKISYVSPSVK